MENDQKLHGIPVEIGGQGVEAFEDKMSLRIVNMSQTEEYDVILGVPWLREYTNLCQPFQITTQERGKCLDVLEEMPGLCTDSEDEEDMPALSYLEEGEMPEAGVFSMSPLCWGFGANKGSPVWPPLEPGSESEDEELEVWHECEAGNEVKDPLDSESVDGAELPCYPPIVEDGPELYTPYAKNLPEAGLSEVPYPGYGVPSAFFDCESEKIDRVQREVREMSEVRESGMPEPEVREIPSREKRKATTSRVFPSSYNVIAKTSGPLPKLGSGKKMRSGVFSVGGGTTGDDKSQVSEIQIARHSEFQSLKKAERKQRRQVKRGKSVSTTMQLLMLSVAALGVFAGAESVQEVGTVAAGLAAAFSAAKTLGFGLATTAEQYGKVSGNMLGTETPLQDWGDALELREGQLASLNQTPSGPCTAAGTLHNNPFLPPSAEIYAELGNTQGNIELGIRALIAEDWELFKEMPHKSQIRRAENEKMSIKPKPGMEFEVPRSRRTKTPVHLQPILRDLLVELLNKGFIKPSTSPFSAPCMMVAKPHQEGTPLDKLEYRMVVDLRDLNRMTVPMHHRIPNIEGIWHTVSKAKYISVLDLSKGFHQESLRENDADEPGNGGTSSSDKTGFSTEWGHFQFVGCVMGATNTPAFFQSKVEMSLRRAGLLDVGLLKSDTTKFQPDRDGNVPVSAKPIPVYDIQNARPCCTPFIDDLIVYSETKEQHLEDLRRVFKCLSDNQYYVNKKKCHFGCKYALFCGGIVGNGILAMDPIKIKAICDWEQPTDVTTLRSFLGLANYLKCWYKNYSDYAGVLTNLLKKGKCVKKDWEPCHTEAFLKLKEGFKNYPILRLPDFTRQFHLVTDSCKHAIGGAICQMYEFDGKKTLMPVAYHSRKMTKHEVNYSVREQECLAIHDCFKKFEYLLLGSAFEVIMETDHSSLKQVELGASLQSSKRLARWAEYMGGFP